MTDILEIKQIGTTPGTTAEKVVDVDEFIKQHELLYEVPLLRGGCIIVRKLGYVERAQLCSRHKAFIDAHAADMAQMAALRGQYKELLAKAEKGDEQATSAALEMGGRIQEMNSEFGEDAATMFKDMLLMIIVEPEVLKDAHKLDSFLRHMEEEEYASFMDLMADFMDTKKKPHPPP